MPLNLNTHTNQAASERASLLDFLANELQCTYLSDLRFLKSNYQQQLIEALTTLSVDEYTLRDWNDALDYLSQLPAQQTAADAKSLLLLALSDSSSGSQCQ